MIISLGDIENAAQALLLKHGQVTMAERAARDCAWLQAVGYDGLKMLAEALAGGNPLLAPKKDELGLDLQNVSCVFIADAVHDMVKQHGRLFLRNVRHGLYLLPGSVNANYGIGCPVDPSFALGGERSKNPYAEKLALAASSGVEVNEVVWHSIALPH